VQFALNLPHFNVYLCERTYATRLKDFRESELAKEVFADVTARLITELDIEVSKQRLDSTHVFSDMARFGRSKLMAETVRRFLSKLEILFPEHYAPLDECLRERYAKSDAQFFGMGRTRIKGDALALLRVQIAKDMHQLIVLFENHMAISALDSYIALARVFSEQCELTNGEVVVIPKSSPHCMQNPSDPDAKYDGHKGPGYQAQIAETYSEKNDVQLITAALPETAAEQDVDAVVPMLHQLADANTSPDSLLTDTSYGSDENVMAAKELGTDLIAPVPGRKPGDDGGDETPLHAVDFTRDDETQEVIQCPMGQEPIAASSDPVNSTHTAAFDPCACKECPRRQQCPAKQKKNESTIQYSDKDVRIEERRRYEKTAAFKDVYRYRAGVEGTMSALKRRLGFGRLSVRGKSAVFNAIYLKAAAYNMLQAARALRIRKKREAAATSSALSCQKACLVLHYEYFEAFTVGPWLAPGFRRRQDARFPLAA
jgi:hypothetical protein